MRTKVVIENGETEIVLTPQNDFEEDVIEKMVNKRSKFDIFTTVDAKHEYGIYNKHYISMNIKETK